MRYLVKARVKQGQHQALQQAIDNKTLGQGSVAEREYIKDMKQARILEDGTVCWVEVCFCASPLLEERPYWEEYFDLQQIKNAHNPQRCRDKNGEEPWACSNCDCTQKLEARMESWGKKFMDELNNS